MSSAACGLMVAVSLLAGCPKAQAPTPGEVAAQMRGSVPSYEALHAAAAAGPTTEYLRVRELGLADLPLGASPVQVRSRYGEPNQRTRTQSGEWWEYQEVLRVAADQEPGEDGKPKKDITGTLRLLFVTGPARIAAVPAVPPTPSPRPLRIGSAKNEKATLDAAPSSKPEPPNLVLAQIQAWAPGNQETRSLVRLLDPVSRVERKYGKATRTLSVGWTGGELWLYPAANVAFVVSPPLPTEEPEGAPAGPLQRVVTGTIVGL